MHRNAKPRNEGEAQDRDKARAALAQMRRKPKLSLRAAARAEGTTTKSMLRYVGAAIRLEHGRYRATPYDRSPRPMTFYSDSGNIPLTIRDSRTASAIGRYVAAYRKYRKGDSSALDAFKGKSFIASGVRYHFVTDADRLDILVDAGLTPDAVYRAVQMPS